MSLGPTVTPVVAAPIRNGVNGTAVAPTAIAAKPRTPSPAEQGVDIAEWMGAELRRLGYSDAQVVMLADFHRNNGHKRSFSQVVLDLGVMPAIEVAEMVSRYFGYPFYDSAKLKPEKDIFKVIPSGVARSRFALPMALVANKVVRVAVADPTVPNFSQVRHALAERDLRPDFVIAPAADILAKLDELNKAPVLGVHDDREASRFVERVIEEAYRDEVSDIHFIPMETSLSIEYRIDGVLMPRHAVSQDRKATMLNGVKIAANQGKGGDNATLAAILDIGNRTVPQDASATRKFGSSRCNLRFSSLPTIFGESIVVRILDQSRGLLPLEKLGMQPDMHAQLMPVLHNANGAVIMIGPTGSGKTTTMYSMLQATNWKARGMAVNTLENPVEFELGNGAKQTEITEKLTWTLGLRAILRQDPDIILAGECRDQETAEMLMAASLTGHLVFSTLHARTAQMGFPRLMDLGVEAGNICAGVEVFIAQRLVRKVCKNCRKPHPQSNMLCQQYQKELAIAGVKDPQFYEGGPGCSECRNMGFRGQVGVFEMLPVWPFQELVTSKRENATPQEYQDVIDAYNKQCVEVRAFRSEKGLLPAIEKFGERLTKAAPIWTLRQDGMIKAGQGITTPEEVWAAT